MQESKHEGKYRKTKTMIRGQVSQRTRTTRSLNKKEQTKLEKKNTEFMADQNRQW